MANSLVKRRRLTCGGKIFPGCVLVCGLQLVRAAALASSRRHLTPSHGKSTGAMTPTGAGTGGEDALLLTTGAEPSPMSTQATGDVSSSLTLPRLPSASSRAVTTGSNSISFAAEAVASTPSKGAGTPAASNTPAVPSRANVSTQSAGEPTMVTGLGSTPAASASSQAPAPAAAPVPGVGHGDLTLTALDGPSGHDHAHTGNHDAGYDGTWDHAGGYYAEDGGLYEPWQQMHDYGKERGPCINALRVREDPCNR